MKNPSEYMLTCISEEAGEVVQVIGKIDRFGLLDINPKMQESNAERLRQEFHDVVATYMEYCDINEIPFELDNDLIQAKLTRVYHFKLYSYLKDRCDIRDDLYRLVECLFHGHQYQQDYLSVIRGELNIGKLEMFYEMINALKNPPKYLIEAIEKLMTCINSNQSA